jgi:trk system potassium uptake protein TrkA
MTTDSEYILIVGCGRLGAYLATKLSAGGHSVVVIDVDEAAFAALGVEFGGFRIEADAAELATLNQAKADKADRLIAVTGDDNVNLAVAQIAARMFNIPSVVARVSDPRKEGIFAELGIDTVCPLALAGRQLLERMSAAPSQEPSA